jgi:hypothetical protein
MKGDPPRRVLDQSPKRRESKQYDNRDKKHTQKRGVYTKPYKSDRSNGNFRSRTNRSDDEDEPVIAKLPVKIPLGDFKVTIANTTSDVEKQVHGTKNTGTVVCV